MRPAGHPRRPERLVVLEAATNFRDLGGYPAAGGETRWGQLFRSDSLHRLTEGDRVRLGRLGVRTVYDLRSAQERERLPSRFPSGDGLRVVGLAFAAGRPGAADLADHGDDGEALLLAVYRRILQDAAPAIGQLVGSLAAADGLPAVFHCAAGKDRTGLAAALVLEAVGVPRDVVLDDYELTSSCWDPSGAADALAALEGEGLPAGLVAVLLGTPRPVLAGALADLDEAHGGVEGYLTGPALVAPGELVALRAALVA